MIIEVFTLEFPDFLQLTHARQALGVPDEEMVNAITDLTTVRVQRSERVISHDLSFSIASPASGRAGEEMLRA